MALSPFSSQSGLMNLREQASLLALQQSLDQKQENDNEIYRRSGSLVSNPNYQVVIRREASGQLPLLEVKANLPETFSFGVSANYDSALPSDFLRMANSIGASSGGLLGFIPGALNTLNQFTKVNFLVQELTHQVWNGSSPISFSLPLLFDAVEDAGEDVVAPIRDLMALVLPYTEEQDSFLIRPPGPTLAEPDHGRVSLKIGRMNYFHSVVIKDVQANFTSRFTKSGSPIAAEADITFETINTPVQSDIDLFFYHSGRQGVTEEERKAYGKPLKKATAQNIGNDFERLKEKFTQITENFEVPSTDQVTESVVARYGISPGEAADLF